MNILCVGGGPGGLFFAIAAKRHDPDHQVTVVERRPAGHTYGWGIAVATSAPGDDLLWGVHEVDPEAARAIRNACSGWGGQRVSVGDGRPVHLGGSGYTMGRQQLIDILLARARALGVEVRFETEVFDESVTARYDLVVLADGARSRFRRAWAARFGTQETAGGNKHIWLTTTKPLDDFTYAFEETPAGWLWFYGYRYEPGASTVIVECSADTWVQLGLGTLPDDVAMAELSRIFARHLDGHPLRSHPDSRGRSPWETFTTVRNARWHCGNVVLLGDCAHTAHFSIGSGTTMALADAAALGRAIASCSPSELPDALQRYEGDRRPAVAALQAAAARSAAWFEDVDRHVALPPLDLGFSLRMRRNSLDDGGRPAVLYGLHRLTQWRLGRGTRRVVAAHRRAAHLRRLDQSGAR